MGHEPPWTMNFSCWHPLVLGKNYQMSISWLKGNGSELEPGLFGVSPRQIPVVLQLKSLPSGFTFQTRSLRPFFVCILCVGPISLVRKADETGGCSAAWASQSFHMNVFVSSEAPDNVNSNCFLCFLAIIWKENSPQQSFRYSLTGDSTGLCERHPLKAHFSLRFSSHLWHFSNYAITGAVMAIVFGSIYSPVLNV